jgi:hypothetical protein
MALHGNFIFNDAYYSPLSFSGVGIFLAFSGNGAYRHSGGCGMIPEKGPVPAGKYWIVERPEGGMRSQLIAGVRDIYNYFARGASFRNSEWFAIWRDGWTIDDYTWVENVKRGNFRLHPGTLSEGCITLPHDADYAMLRNALLRTEKVEVPCMKQLLAYGTIEAIANGKTCP